MGPSQQPLPLRVADSASARHLGDLVRGDARWSVYLETAPRGETVGGRVHFLDGERRRSTAWIFLEWNEHEVISRFNEFSAVELWRLVESLDTVPSPS